MPTLCSSRRCGRPFKRLIVRDAPAPTQWKYGHARLAQQPGIETRPPKYCKWVIRAGRPSNHTAPVSVTASAKVLQDASTRGSGDGEWSVAPARRVGRMVGPMWSHSSPSGYTRTPPPHRRREQQRRRFQVERELRSCSGQASRLDLDDGHAVLGRTRRVDRAVHQLPLRGAAQTALRAPFARREEPAPRPAGVAMAAKRATASRMTAARSARPHARAGARASRRSASTARSASVRRHPACSNSRCTSVPAERAESAPDPLPHARSRAVRRSAIAVAARRSAAPRRRSGRSRCGPGGIGRGRGRPQQPGSTGRTPGDDRRSCAPLHSSTRPGRPSFAAARRDR